jgi:crotonobetainyl-CoA:carnitine CoA-transferase CaiB-like acyl-CoA transferase
MAESEGDGQGPLAGFRILDISTIVAGPWAAALLGDLGAEVLKIELPGGGDAMRQIAPHKDGVPLWFKVTNRNKRGITLDLRKPEGKALFERLLLRFDVLIENFRPGTLDAWGLGWARLSALHPTLTVLRVSGFGQTGPYARRPAYAKVAEALAGFTQICGEADGPPLHLGFPIADAFSGLFGAFGIVAALCARLREPGSPGQEIDVNLAESILRVLDFLPVEYDQLGVVRGRSGNLSDYAAPSNVYRTADGKWVTLPASTQRMFERLAHALGRPELLDDPRFRSNAERLRHREALDAIVAAELASRPTAELADLFERHEIGASPIQTIADVFADPHFQARETIVAVPDAELGSLRMQNVVPRFSRTPGAIARTGPALGADNDEIYGDWLGLAPAEIARLRSAGVI